MRRLIVLLLLLGALHLHAEPLRVTTWNLNSSDTPTAVSEGTDADRLAEIAAVLNSLNADVILVQDVHDLPTCERLAGLLKPARYRVAVCSSFTDVPGHQVAILSRKSIVTAWAKPWKADRAVAPPGGFAFARVRHASGDVAVFSVLLGNSAAIGNVERDTQLNILARETAAAQLVQQAASLGSQPSDQPSAVFAAGSFNTNPDEPQFVSEITLRLLEHAGFKNAFQGVPLEDRITRRGDGRDPDATVDYVFARNSDFLTRPRVVATELSAHFPVACEAILKRPAPAAKGPTAFQPAAHWQSIGLTFGVVLFLFAWWWVVGRKRFYSPASAALVASGGSNLLSFSESYGSFPALTEGIDEPEADDHWLPARTRHELGRLQIQSLEQRAATAEQRARQATEVVRQGLISHLARLMKNRLFQGLTSQRAHLLLTQESGASQVAALEERLARVQSQMQNRFGAYERRIAELEKEVMAKEKLNRELLQTKAQILKQAHAAAQTRQEEAPSIQ